MHTNTPRTWIFLFCMLCAGGALAQPQGGRGQRPQGEMQQPALPDSSQVERMMTELTELLSLDDGQRAEITALHLAHFAAVGELTSQGRPSRKDMEALRAEFEADVKALLDEEQVAGFEDFVASRRPGPPRGGRGR